MEFLTAELIASYRLQPQNFQTGLKLQTLMALTRRTRGRQIIRDCSWGRSRGMNAGGKMELLWECLSMCRGGVGIRGKDGGMIETSNQSHCREQRTGRGLLPVVTLLSVPVFFAFSRAHGSIDEWSEARRFWHTVWHAFLIHCVITCAILMYTAQGRRVGGSKSHPPAGALGWLHRLYFH